MSDPAGLILFRRGNGVYYVCYSDNGRKRWKSTKARLKSDALQALRDFEKLFRPRTRPVCLSRFTTDYLAFAEANFVSGSVDIGRAALRNFMNHVGDVTLQSITQRDVDQYKVERLKTIKAVTVNIELRTLRSAFNLAKRWKLIVENPFGGVELLSVPEQQPVFLSKANFAVLMALVQEQWLRELIMFAVATGMRQGEMLNLRWTDVDLAQKLIHIQSNPTFRTKQGKRRTIPMSKSVHSMLRAKARRSRSDLVFVRKGFKIGESYLSHQFKKYVRGAALDDRLHFHSLRHTFASWLVQDGVSLYEVQKLLGHSSFVVTQIYSHLQPEQLHATVNRIDVSLN